MNRFNIYPFTHSFIYALPMGLCINYRGKLKTPETAYPLIEDMKDICETMDWQFVIRDDDWTQPNDVMYKGRTDDNTFRIEGKAHLKGIGFSVHPKCDPIMFYFDSKGIINSENFIALKNMGIEEEEMLWQWTKTSKANTDAHITVCKLLDYVKGKYFEQLDIRDDTQYWETRDMDKLESNFAIMSALSGVFESGGMDLINKLLDARK